jgi:predicted RecB family nuclease
MEPHELTRALFSQRAIPRGDEDLPHCADLWACDRQTWYRRNGFAGEQFDRAKLAQFAIGHGYEREVADTLAAAGHKVDTDLEVYHLGLFGHPDIVVDDDLLVECKTTELQKPKDEVSQHYAIQAAFYALALPVPQAVVLVKHARSHAEVAYPVKPQAYRGMIERRAAEIIATTGIGAPMPPADPGPLAPWGCTYCPHVQCERNPKHDAADDLMPFADEVAL